FAELLVNSLDEVIEDNGGGMTPDKIRGCMSLSYSEKSKPTLSVNLLVNSLDEVTEDNGGGMTPNKIRGCMSLSYSEKSRPTLSVNVDDI
ncbi:hypothetical protein Tco_1511393, partial [Tanacetum coccineum]